MPGMETACPPTYFLKKDVLVQAPLSKPITSPPLGRLWILTSGICILSSPPCVNYFLVLSGVAKAAWDAKEKNTVTPMHPNDPPPLTCCTWKNVDNKSSKRIIYNRAISLQLARSWGKVGNEWARWRGNLMNHVHTLSTTSIAKQKICTKPPKTPKTAELV